MVPPGRGTPSFPEGPSIYIADVDDEEILTLGARILADLHDLTKMVTAIHAELEEFRPILAAFKPGNGASDLQRAGILRTMRRAAKGG